ncbi:NucA/NucB deoxyribonuclease domain-containing protein [Streptomyces uncialis]
MQTRKRLGTTIRNPGYQDKCKTNWNLTLTNPPYSSAPATYSFHDFRCDNNTAGRPGVGCVVPCYASVLWYSKSRYPQLTSHATRAQNSGLPGATFAKPLTRTTHATTVSDTRRLACGDAPSIHLKSCDEYPIAQSQQGLSSGGARRSFTGCNFNRVPAGTGPRGASACMIKATENNAQGGLNTQFFRSRRVLNGDPFQIRVD